MPCHSLGYLNQSIASISNQTLPKDKFEILFVADRIDSESARKILINSQLNFRLIESDVPGIVPALNLGLNNSSAEFIARMDEDDIMTPERLELQLKYLAMNSKTLALGGQIKLIDQNNKTIGFTHYRRNVKERDFHLLDSSPLAHPAVMYRRKNVENLGGYRDFLPEDWDLWARLAEHGRLDNLSQIVLNYRVHPTQLSREKMYSQDLGREFVATSYFARKEKIQDHPASKETKNLWLNDTQSELREFSKEFKSFENRSHKRKMMMNHLQKKNLIGRWKLAIPVIARSPVLATKIIINQVIIRIRISRLQSINSPK
jgi:glycosyltransferase involved in cell wall biosynthesis